MRLLPSHILCATVRSRAAAPPPLALLKQPRRAISFSPLRWSQRSSSAATADVDADASPASPQTSTCSPPTQPPPPPPPRTPDARWRRYARVILMPWHGRLETECQLRAAVRRFESLNKIVWGCVKTVTKQVGRATVWVVDVAQTRTSEGVGALLLWVSIVAAMVACAPTTPLNLAAGALLGVSKGAFVVLTALWAGSLINFTCAKSLFREYAQAKLEAMSLTPDSLHPSHFDGAAMTFLLRLCVVLPAGGISYALGATEMDVRDYAFGTLAGQAVTSYLFSTIGHVLRCISHEPNMLKRAYLRGALGSATAAVAGAAIVSSYQLTAYAVSQ